MVLISRDLNVASAFQELRTAEQNLELGANPLLQFVRSAPLQLKQ